MHMSGVVPRVAKLLHDARFVHDRKWIAFALHNLLEAFPDGSFPSAQIIAGGMCYRIARARSVTST